MCTSRLLLVNFYLSEVFSEDLDQVGHGKVQDVVPPGQLQDHVRTKEIVAWEQARSEAVRPPDLKEPTNETLRNLDVSRVTCILHGILCTCEKEEREEEGEG